MNIHTSYRCLIFFLTIATLVSCMPSEEIPMISWDHPDDDSFVEFTPEREAFVETSSPGVVGGILVLRLPGGHTFTEGVENRITFQNVPAGLKPDVKRNQTSDTLFIRLSGVAEHHSHMHSRDDISLYFSHDDIHPQRNRSIEIDGIKVLFHDVPVVWKSPVTSEEYLLVFNDEFNRDTIDTHRWRYRADGFARITRTIEYDGRPIDIVVVDEASFIDDNNMVLKVYKEDAYPDQVFTGGLHTHDRFMPRFGYFETRATFREVTGFGHWPAFWVHYFYRDRHVQGTEIDIFEYIAAENRIYQTIHWHTPGEHYRSSENFVLEDLDEYHIFGLEWTPDELIFYVNGEVTKHLKKSDNERYVPNSYQMVFFSMSAGVWGGNVADPSNELPASSRFDYCRVYQRPGDYSYYYYPENGPDNNRRHVHLKAENRRTLY